MSWGTYYKHKGYLSHICENELDNKYDECKQINDMIWREILSYMASTPPATAKDFEGNEYPWPEFIANKVREFRETIEENNHLMARINDCIEAREDNPENVWS